MPRREIIGKSTAFGLIALACIGGGVLAFYGPHAYNDYFNTLLGVILVLIGLGVGGMGTLIILGIVAEARAEERETRLEVTPRPGPLGPPPPWGMGDVGRPGSGGVREVGGAQPTGGGGPRLMSVKVSSLDAPVVIGLLLVWSVVALILWAPR